MTKTAFVRSLPASTPGAEVVKRAKEAGLTISLGYVYSIRAKSHARGPAKAHRRGPGRPRKDEARMVPRAAGRAQSALLGGGLVAAIEAVVESKVRELLANRLGALFK
jgi:hypothetical protein